MPNVSSTPDGGFETRYEWLRPAQLIERRDQCPLIFFPVAPLEYHGPHLPVGVDPISATEVAHACCRTLEKGVVRPTMFLGTERERDAATLEALGFRPDEYIVGMDFPACPWGSHYLPEEVFALTLAAELRCVISHGYKLVYIVNGHGAVNHNAVIRRLCAELSATTPAKVAYSVSFPDDALDSGAIGHADFAETSLVMHYDPKSVNLDALPRPGTPLKYADFSIVDGAGFTPKRNDARVVPPEHDPRRATPEAGKEYFERTVRSLGAKVGRLLETL